MNLENTRSWKRGTKRWHVWNAAWGNYGGMTKVWKQPDKHKEEKAREKISRKELEEAVGRKLDEDEVKRLKKARREGDYHEALLLVKVKNKHDKYS